MAHEGRLSGSDLAGNDAEPGVVQHTEFEHRKSHPMRLTPIDQIGVGQDRERFFPEAVILFVHQQSLMAPLITLQRSSGAILIAVRQSHNTRWVVSKATQPFNYTTMADSKFNTCPWHGGKHQPRV